MITPQNGPARGQVQICYTLTVILFEKGKSSYKQEFSEVRIKRQMLDHYPKSICKITSNYGVLFTTETVSAKSKHTTHQTQTDDIETDFSKVLSDYTKKNTTKFLKSKFNINKQCFSIIFNYLFILEMKETENGNQTSRHSSVIEEVCIFSNFLKTIRENLISHEISQNVKHDLQKIISWFIIYYLVHNIDLIALSRKSFRPQNSDDETVLADETDYVWDPDWSYPLFINLPTDKLCQAFTTISSIKTTLEQLHLLLMQHLQIIM